MDPETGRWRMVDTANAETRRRFHQSAEEFDRSLQQNVLERGGDLVRLETGRSYAEQLIAFFRRRELGKRFRAGGSKVSRAVAWLGILAFLGLAPLRQAAAQISGQSFEVMVPNKPATVGDSVTLEFRVRLDDRDLLFDTIPQPIGDLPEGVRILSVEKLERTPDRIFHGHARLAFYRPGRQRVPVFGLPFMRAVKGVQRATLPSDSAFVDVRSLLPPGNPPLKDIREIEHTARPPLLRWILAVVVAVVGLLVAWRRRRRRSQTTAAIEELISVEPVEQLSAYERAREEFRRIEHAAWPRNGMVARHYESVVDVLRDYLESAESIPARERTTAELLWALPPYLTESGRRDRLRELLEEADLVKFARLEPSETRAKAFLERSRTLLEDWHAAAPSVAELSDAVR
jgi:hypothetical protein